MESPPKNARAKRWLQALMALGLLMAGLFGTASGVQARQHTVRQGQTLARIARRYHVSVDDLKAANRLRTSRLRLGQVLRIPNVGEIFVRRGETLSHIARRMHVSQNELRRANRLRRGRGLRVGQRLVMPGYSVAERSDRSFGDPTVPGRVTLIRHSERVELQLVDGEGRVHQDALQPLGNMMRRHDDDSVPPANARLAFLLAKISDHFGGRAIRIVSGYRSAGGYTRETSRHTQGRATDIRISGVPNRTIWEVCRRIDHAGCGFYPRSTFVHVDARLSRTQWVDWSRPGRRARYGTLRGPAGRRRRRRMTRPRVTSDLSLNITLVDAAGETVLFEDSQAAEEHAQDQDEGDLVDDDAASRSRPLWREM